MQKLLKIILLVLFVGVTCVVTTIPLLAQEEYDYQDEYDGGISDAYNDGRSDWTNRLGTTVPKPPPRYDPFDDEKTESGILFSLRQKNTALYYCYKYLNPPFLDNLIVLVMTVLGAAFSIVGCTMLTAPEERGILITVIALGAYCWLRLIVIFSAALVTGHRIF